MAMSQAAALLEKVIGHGDNAQTEQDITNPARDRARFGHPTEVWSFRHKESTNCASDLFVQTMKALCWMGKNTVKVGKSDGTL